MRARHRVSGTVFALKMMNKAQVKRMSVRHKNINNEIMMEKQALLQLRGHPNIVTLYHTFSDENSLFFLLEMVTGGELWNRIMDAGAPVGCDVSVARFYLLQILNALEGIHSAGYIHRCVDPTEALPVPT